MFTVATEPKFTHEVTAQVPVDGGFDEQTFRVTYKALDPEVLDAFDVSTTAGSTEFLRAIVSELGGLVDPDGNELPFNDDLFGRVLKLPWARKAISRGYFEAIAGARRGN